MERQLSQSFRKVQKKSKDDFNRPRMRTTESRNDAARVVVDTNYIGQPITEILTGIGGRWINHFKYQSKTARLETWHYPSNINHGARDVEEPETFPHAGAVRFLEYNRDGYVEYDGIKKGVKASGTAKERLVRFAYKKGGGDAGVQALSMMSILGAGSGISKANDARTIDNLKWEGRTALIHRTTSFVNIPSAEGGMDGDGNQIIEKFDKYGNIEYLKDLHFGVWVFDTRAEDAARRSVRGYYFVWVIDEEKAANSSSAGAIGALTHDELTTIESDDYGRPLVVRAPQVAIITDPTLVSGKAASARPTTTLRYDDIDGRVVIAQGYGNDSGNPTLVGPFEIRMFDRAGRRVATIATTVYPTEGERLPDRARWCRATTDEYDNRSRLTATRVYHDIKGGKADITQFGYDLMYRLRTIRTPGGTLIRTEYDARGLETRSMMGTSEDNLRPVETRVYDLPESRADSKDLARSQGGDGHLCRQTLHASPNRVVAFKHDYRGRVVQQYVPAGNGGSPTADRKIPAIYYTSHTRQGDWIKRVVVPSPENVTPRNGVHTVREINARGNPYRISTIGYGDTFDGTWLQPQTGEFFRGDAFEERIWYRQSGEVIRQEADGSDRFTRFIFDGRGRLNISYSGIGSGFTSLRPDLVPRFSTGEGEIVEASVVQFDRAGNPVRNEVWNRMTTKDGSGLAPQQVYTQFDALGRPRFMSQLKRTWRQAHPQQPFRPGPFTQQPVGATLYNDRGEAYRSVEFHQGLQYRTQAATYDDAGRARRVVRNLVTGQPRASVPDQDIVAEMDYTPDGQVRRLAVKAVPGQWQITTNNYGTSVGSGSSVACSYWLESVVDPGGARTRFTRNAQGDVTSVIDPNGTKHTFKFDVLGRVLEDRASPGKNVDGRVVASQFNFDYLGRLRDAISESAGGANRLLACKRTYALRGQVLSETQEFADLGKTATVQYDYGQRNKPDSPRAIVYPSGVTAGLAGDGMGSKSAVFLNGTSVGNYDFAGLRAAILKERPAIRGFLPNDYLRRQAVSRDSLDEYFRSISTLWNVGLEPGPPYSEVYDNGFSQVGVSSRRESHSARQYFQHDAANRLDRTETTIGSGATLQTLKNDSVGNVVEYAEYNPWDGKHAAQPDLRQKRDFNRKNQITNITTFKGPKWSKPVYDGVGNATEIPQPGDPTKKFTCKYDAWNRLVEVRDPSLPAGKQIVADYRYDAFDRRVMKRRFSNNQLIESRYFFYSTNWRVLEEWRSTSSSDTPSREIAYLWGFRGLDELLLRIKQTGQTEELLAPIQDELFNTTALLQRTSNGADVVTVERYYYDAYGRPHVLSPTSTPREASEYGWRQLFGGYYYDEETGLYHVRRRMLHPTLGTWLQPDPAGYIDGPNLYQYGRGSPVTFVDPTGQWALLPFVLTFLGTTTSATLIDPGQGLSVSPAQRQAIINNYHSQRIGDFASWMSFAAGGAAYGWMRAAGWGLTPSLAASGVAFNTTSDAVIFGGTGDLPHYRDAQGNYSFERVAAAYGLSAAGGIAFSPVAGLLGGAAGRAWALAARSSRPGLSLLSRMVRVAVEPLATRISQMRLPYRQRITFSIRIQRLFVTATQGHPGVSASPIGRLLQRLPLIRRLNWEQGHVFWQRRWFRPGSRTQWYPNNPAANRGLQRLGNAGINLLPMPRALNQFMGRHPWYSFGFGAITGGGVAGSVYGAWRFGTAIGSELADVITDMVDEVFDDD